MLEPQSTALFILLLLAFGCLVVLVAVAGQPAFRVLAASAAFVPAMLFGVAAVNKYYGYYQTWGAVLADLQAAGGGTPAQLNGAAEQGPPRMAGKVAAGTMAAQRGEMLRLTVGGRRSHLRRAVYVYLPPQYFQPGYRRYRFPALELISGFPGQPQDWINVVGITQTYQTLLRERRVKPVVLVMPDPNGGPQLSLQCLNVVHGPQDATFLAADVPRALAGSLRLRGSGPAWGIAGYSEGGFCAANLALVYPWRYGYAGVLSGYFRPSADRLGSPPRYVPPFGRNAALRRQNTPLRQVRVLSLAVRIPWFWLGAGSADGQDVRAAEAFQQALLTRQPNAQVHLARGGAHNMTTWRALTLPLLEWITPRLAYAASHDPHDDARSRQAAPQDARSRRPRPFPSPQGTPPSRNNAPVPLPSVSPPAAHRRRTHHSRSHRGR